jgi:hypothetical protein
MCTAALKRVPAHMLLPLQITQPCGCRALCFRIEDSIIIPIVHSPKSVSLCAFLLARRPVASTTSCQHLANWDPLLLHASDTHRIIPISAFQSLIFLSFKLFMHPFQLGNDQS